MSVFARVREREKGGGRERVVECGRAEFLFFMLARVRTPSSPVRERERYRYKERE